MSRFFRSKKKKKKHITSAREYYDEHYAKDLEGTEDTREQIILSKLAAVGAVNIKKSSGFITSYVFDLPVEHKDDLYQRINLNEESDQEINISAELIEEFPFFLNIIVKPLTDNRSTQSLQGVNIRDFAYIQTDNEKKTDLILGDSIVNGSFIILLPCLKLISLQKNTLTARLTNIDELGDFFKLMTQIAKIAIKP